MAKIALEQSKISKLMVANRGEIAIRVLRAAAELGLRTVAIYTYEDRYSLHRYKADESYQIGENDDPLRPYLDIEGIISLALKAGVTAIHPGYGFLSENVEFAKRCEEVGIAFVGPASSVMQQLGDKVRCKAVARKVNVPVIEDVDISDLPAEELVSAAERLGMPIIVKAAGGGGGRGMRVVREIGELEQAVHEARTEAGRAFGNERMFLEKFIEKPKHVEVQLLGDSYGNLVHLFERDCSVQRRFQKVVEVSPCAGISAETREKLFEYALKIGRHVSYCNAGTVEFLIDKEERIYFIEVNPRIQVEHTVTEEVTGIDIVRAQLLIASGAALADPRIGIASQEAVKLNGYAIQCRVTTEDPLDNFRPDTGRIIAYRSPGGFGIRLDGGSAYAGTVISPFFDSMLVKVTASGRTLAGTSVRLKRALQEFRIRGVKTNLAFLDNVISHEDFQSGNVNVGFIDEHPELFDLWQGQDRGTRLLSYLAEVIVNGNPDVKSTNRTVELRTPKIPRVDTDKPVPDGSKQRLEKLGRDGFVKSLRDDKQVQFTDTTFRDAHQSLLATRVRTKDLQLVARSFAVAHPEVFSMEVWGGATFDVALRFLHECPWERLRILREAMPNILLQMLLRGSNAVGYSAYPDNLIISFIEEAAETGIDIFRIFDSMNWLPAMETSIKAVRERTKSLAEVCLCYTGDISDPSRTKYNLQYYVDLAKRIEDTGAHILAIKDMAGLLKPYAAEQLIPALRDAVSLPIHLHTHDTSAIQTATYMKAIESGIDVVDVALASMSGLTSQPNFNSLVAALKGSEWDTGINLTSLNAFSRYWETVREYYYPFESGLKAGTAEVYDHEIPGGQYSNLRPQARGLGLEEQFEQIIENYREVNTLLGDLVKVTPSSKVVGDVALFMVSNGLTIDDVRERAGELSFPESLKSFLRGDLGQPYQGFPADLQKAILKDEAPYTCRPNEHLDPIPLQEEFKEFQKRHGEEYGYTDYLSSKLYPAVFEDFYQFQLTYGEVRALPTPAFFYGMKSGEEILVDIDRGKTLMVRLVYVTDPDEAGVRTVVFKLNGQTRGIEVVDSKIHVAKRVHPKAGAVGEIGSPLQGKLSEVLVEVGEEIVQGQPLFVIEAMKMESSVAAPGSGVVRQIALQAGDLVEQDDLIISFEVQE